MQARPNPSCVVSLHTEGSVPEAPGLFECIDRLDGKVYSKEAVNACLQSLENTKYFEDVAIKEEPLEPRKVNIAFFLKSKPLVLVSLDFDMPEAERLDFLAWSHGKARLLEQGAPYDRQIALETVHAIEFFYQQGGAIAKVSTSTSLDYVTQTASVRFHVTTGPHLPQEDLVPPYVPECLPLVTGLDWSDVDDNTPIPLVKSLVALTGTGACFSTEKIDADENSLRQSGIFREASISSSGTPKHKEVSLQLRSKALPLTWTKLQYYGPAEGTDCGAGIRFPEEGTTYSRTLANTLKQKLQAACGNEEFGADAYEQDVLLNGSSLGLLFHIIRYPRYTLTINGERVGRTVHTDGY